MQSEDSPLSLIGGGHKPTLVIVSGPPGSGKTTLGRALAQAISCPLVSRDEINEGIFHTFHHDLAIASKEAVARIAFDAFFQTIGLLVSAHVTLVAEAAFQDYRWRLGLDPFLTMAEPRIIHCVIDAHLARQRIVRRQLEQRESPSAKRAARQSNAAGKPKAVNDSFVRLSLPVPTLHVATTNGYDPDLDDIAAFATFRSGDS